ncbi:UDP-3-O-(3-hydroxymyristoyl)glucosamine N-acyltransferase [Leptolyngbya sp. AN02str]|uniref:UDP-3-O-(3-hydroxymyristoyl)glucosamine N-acyltransferase n=1 Tax=Leptolyngbya sp. AN02str TaxID=3423363 RepID=UPI003D31BD88
MGMKFSEVVQALGHTGATNLTTHAEHNPEILGVAAIDEASPGLLSYVDGGKFAAQVATTQASALILPMDETLQAQATERSIAWIATKQPRLVFAQAIALFYKPYQLPAGIHPTAVIDPSVTLGQDVAIGAHVVIQAGCTIGNGVCIHPNVVVYPQASVGDRTVLHANCVIHERSQVGANCVIHAGAVIGSEGFGFVPTAEGWLKMEQSGITVLEDGVEIGCNSAVDRPAVGETRIGRYTKLDNFVQVGHGCTIGQACAIAAHTGLAGGVQLGNRVILGGQVGVSNQTKIGDGAQAGAQAGIHSDVAPGEVVVGTPAIGYKLFLKVSAIMNRLPDMHQTVKRLQKQIEGSQADRG